MKTANALKIGQDYIPIQSLDEASTLWNEARDFMEAKTGERYAPTVTACVDKKLYRLTYNGRVWDAATGLEIAVNGRKTAAQHEIEGWMDCR